MTRPNFLLFDEHELHLAPPLTVVAGLDLIRGAILTRAKLDWLKKPPAERRCLEERIYHVWTVSALDGQPKVPNEFYHALFDACELHFDEEPKVYRYPQ